MSKRLILGTRGSLLALAQSRHVAEEITRLSGIPVELQIFTTRGDLVQDRPLPEVGGKGLFTAELEAALHSGDIDLAVHSLKDLPTDMPAGLQLGCIPQREAPWDVLVGSALDALPAGSVVGTGSARRAAQLKAARPDITIEGIRGNVDTRLRKLREGNYDAIVLARAGLNRLGLQVDGYDLDAEVCTPAPGQGALGIQCRTGDQRVLAALAPLEHAATRVAIRAERAFLAALGGGCSVPAGAYATLDGATVKLTAVLADEAGVRRVTQVAPAPEAGMLGYALAKNLLAG